ncbi:hypothetical protein JOY44_06455 [Phormidium sp. CLA17]|uniref:hypothetical protein n=1 Tax=Leptolyngbya sp. Cla-17 TaxID=2803751 RepID=UPI001492F42E|nr:hypothetical protein [Leptolyngbya sp. Cla-17]MBM0741262.1 hypothetical protein [Leptolyngbya sp. Cla-17]
MNHQLLSIWVAAVSIGVFPALIQATPAAPRSEKSSSMTVRRSLQLMAQGRQPIYLQVPQAQIQELRSLGMRVAMPINLPSGMKLTSIAGRSNPRFGRGYLLVYRAGSKCFAVEGATDGIGGIPDGTAGSFKVQNPAMGKGAIEVQKPGATAPLLIGQWMSRGPFYRVVGANYTIDGLGSDLANCQDLSAKEAVVVSESLRFLDLEPATMEKLPPNTVQALDPNSATSPVVGYPNNQELTQFKRNLKSGAYGKGIQLAATDRTQRQAFQATIAKANPTISKFIGAWTTGDRVYYVYPSKVKSRVCVVTNSGNNGKLEFSNGTAISRELRYQDNGLYWVDQADVLASRDKGTGTLYPIFAASSAPSTTALADFDYGFRNAECSPQLPSVAGASQ